MFNVVYYQVSISKQGYYLGVFGCTTNVDKVNHIIHCLYNYTGYREITKVTIQLVWVIYAVYLLVFMKAVIMYGVLYSLRSAVQFG